MSVDIGEIGVRLAVRDPRDTTQAPAPGAAGPARLAPEQQDEIVRECVRLVLGALHAREER